MTATDARVAPIIEPRRRLEGDGDTLEWLIDNAETYGRLFASLRFARKTVHIAQLAFDPDCAAFSPVSLTGAPSSDELISELLIDLAKEQGVGVRILLNASWILNTARPLRKFFARRGVSEKQIEVRGFSRFPHFMHAKLVLIDGREAFLLGSPFVNSYWDDGGHAPFDARRPLRELGGRPLHDVSVHLRGGVVRDLEALFDSVWASVKGDAITVLPAHTTASAVRVVCDAPDGVLPNSAPGSKHMLGELLAGIDRARSFIYVEHQYLTSRPIVKALTLALRDQPALEIIIVLNQNPDLTAYRGWQNAQLRAHALLSHPRVGVFTLWSTSGHPNRAEAVRINHLFIHSKVIIVDDEWAAVGTSNLDGVSMGDYGGDFAGALGRKIFKGVRNVEVNLVIDFREGAELEGDAIVALRERLWEEHLGIARSELEERVKGGRLALWNEAARANVRMLGSSGESSPRAVGRVLPYSERAYPREQLADLGISTDQSRLAVCYTPTWFGVHLSPHWIRNIF